MNNKSTLIATLSIFASSLAMDVSAETTDFGKIKRTQGHYVPDCRMVVHVENISGIERTFRIKDIAGDDDVQSIILMALGTDKNVRIRYEEGLTTGCGTEPMIHWIDISTN